MDEQLIGLGETANRLNGILDAVERFVDSTLSVDEKREYIENGYGHLMETLRPDFPHPKATDDLNLSLLGLDPKPFEQKLRELTTSFRMNGMELSDKGQVVISAAKKKEVREKNRVYTKNQNQNRVFDVATKLIGKLSPDIIEYNEYIPGNYSLRSNMQEIADAFGFIDVEQNEAGEHRFVPNVARIKQY